MEGKVRLQQYFAESKRRLMLKGMSFRLLRSSLLALFAISLPFLSSGCRHGDSFDMSHNASRWSAAEFSARQELAQIPAPTKGDYQTINQESQWQNPFLTVETEMIQLRIYLPDENPSDVDRGGMTRLSAARKHTLNIRLADLPRALTSLPKGAWPYGRVIAINQELAPPQAQPQLDKNLAITIGALQSMGIVVDDWTGRGRAQ